MARREPAAAGVRSLLLLALAAAAVWLLLGLSQQQRAESSAGVTAGPSLLPGADQDGEGVAAVAGQLAVVALLGAVVLVRLLPVAGAGAVAVAPLRARAPPGD